jgi:hypothetical protein
MHFYFCEYKWNIARLWIHLFNFVFFDIIIRGGAGANGSVVGWGTVLQAGRVRVRFPMRTLDFSDHLTFQAALWSWGLLSL